MAIYIKGMEMPKPCYECWALDDDYDYPMCRITQEQRGYNFDTRRRKMAKCPLINVLEPPIEIEKKKAKLKENGDWDCPDVGCDECDHHRSVEWCSLAIPNHEEIDDTYKMVNEAFFEGFDAAEKRYRFLIEYVEELDKKLADVEWIPCDERLPSESGDYLCTIPLDARKTYTKVLTFYKGKFYEDNIDEWGALYHDDVLAWMSLPMPYKEKSEV